MLCPFKMSNLEFKNVCFPAWFGVNKASWALLGNGSPECAHSMHGLKCRGARGRKKLQRNLGRTGWVDARRWNCGVCPLCMVSSPLCFPKEVKLKSQERTWWSQMIIPATLIFSSCGLEKVCCCSVGPWTPNPQPQPHNYVGHRCVHQVWPE